MFIISRGLFPRELNANEEMATKKERLLIERKGLFYSLIQNSSDIITVVGTDGVIRYESPSIERLLGYTPDELIGRNAFTLVHPEDLQMVTNAFTRIVLDPALSLSSEFRCKHKNGSWLVIEATGSNQVDNPMIGGIVLNSRDITERCNAEALLSGASQQAAEERAKLEAVIAAIGDGISVQDMDFRILFMNEIARNMFGDHTGEYCYRVYEERDKICELCPLAMCFADGGIHREERSNPSRNLHVEITASPVRDKSGRTIGGIEVVRDISERRWAEREREKLICELQAAVASIKTLRGLIPMCAWCNKIREDSGYWKKVETYIQEHSDASFTHGICPDCLKKQDPRTYEDIFGREQEQEDLKREQRRFRRTQLETPLACVLHVDLGASGEKLLHAVIENTSDGGMCVRTGVPLRKGCTVTVSDAEGDRSGVVRWRKEDDGDPKNFRIGIQFFRRRVNQQRILRAGHKVRQ